MDIALLQLKEGKIMKISSLLLVTLSVFMFKPALAAQVEVEWSESSNFTDIKGNGTSQKKHEEYVFRQLAEHFEALAEETLPEQFKMKVKVVNLDLAGSVYPFEARTLTANEPPLIEFEYQLLDGQHVVHSQRVELLDPKIMFRARIEKPTAYNHEKHLITEWFQNELQPALAEPKSQGTTFI